MTIILINGIGAPLGARIARRLADQEGITVRGVGQVDGLTAAPTGQQLVALLKAERAEVVIQVGFLGADAPPPGREAAVQQNVIGSMELLGACAAAGVRRVVVRSHTGVYGAAPTNPVFIDERWPIARHGLSGIVRDFAEVERFIDDFAPRHPGLAVSRLRCAPMIGAWSPMVGYLAQPGPRTLFGFNPILQLLHIDDAAAAFALAALGPAAGSFNLAAADTVSLSQAIRLAGRQPVPVPEPVVALAALGGHSPLADWPYDISFLRYSYVADTRRARNELGWVPAHGAAAALRASRNLLVPVGGCS